MSTLLLVRHGLTEMTGPVLAGRTPGVHLNDRGRNQAASLAERLRTVPIAAVVSSPLERCRETAAPLVVGRDRKVQVERRLLECDYGDWTGRELKKLAKEPQWKVVQAHASSAEFPGGETLRAMSARAVDAVRDWNARLGPDAVWVAVSHGDPIKAIVADALGLHLDEFQRIVVDPGSLTVIRYTSLRPFLVRLNDSGGDLAGLSAKPKRGRRRDSDAAVGGGAPK